MRLSFDQRIEPDGCRRVIVAAPWGNLFLVFGGNAQLTQRREEPIPRTLAPG